MSTAILVACVLLAVIDPWISTEGPDGRPLQLGALYGPLVAEGEWWRVLLSALEHGSGFNLGLKAVHLGFNAMVLWSLGGPLERLIGSGRFALTSLISALGASAFSLWLSFDSITTGASGMILGYAGAMLPIVRRTQRRALLLWLAQIALISLLPMVSWQGHLGGVVFGLGCGALLRGGPAAFRWLAGPLLVSALVAVYLAGARTP